MSPFSSPVFSKHSNIYNFLSSVTPTVWSQSLQQDDEDTIEYLALGDLWDCYEEWSAYGVGVPIVLNNDESVTQYYVPYLSAIQIYTNNPQQTTRNLKENGDVATVEDDEAWSKQSESDKSSSNESFKACDDISIEGNNDSCDNSSLEAERLGHLYFKFCDTCSPYSRIPFADKIAELAEVSPGLLTLKNVDLSPASWISIAWYPIYHIPSKENCNDCLPTCFLTYHTLSSFSQEITDVNADKNGKEECNESFDELVKGEYEEGNSDNSGSALFPFGLVTYKLEDEIWINSDDDNERIIDLFKAAESWLKQLNFWHHDFNFFTS